MVRLIEPEAPRRAADDGVAPGRSVQRHQRLSPCDPANHKEG